MSRAVSLYQILMKGYIILYLLTIPFYAYTQYGFSKTILYPNSRSATISAVTTDQDTIVCFGTLYGIAEQKWGAYLAKFDSSGNFLQITTDFDSTYQQTVDYFAQILCTSDGGYIGVSAQGLGYKSAAYKFSHEGVLEWTSFYREDDMQVILLTSVTELNDGFLMFGQYAVDYDNNSFCMKISKNGDFQWINKDIEVVGFNDRGVGRVVKHGENFVLGIDVDPLNLSLLDPSYWSQARLVEVDSLGNVQWEWSNSMEEDDSAVSGLVTTPDTNIIYVGRKFHSDGTGGHDFQVLVRKVNPETSTTVWRKSLTPVNLTSNSALYHLLPSPDGSGFDAIGVRQDKDIGFIISGWVAHLNWDGVIQWQRYDTVYVDTNLWINKNELFNLAHLSSGSIIGAGIVRSATPIGHYEGWLIKWSANGCVMPGDCAIVNTHEDLSGQHNKGLSHWDLFPNPAQEHTWLSQPESHIFSDLTIQISNMPGQIIQSLAYPYNAEGQYKIPLEGLQQGLYFYQVSTDGVPQQSGRLLVMD